MAANLPRPLEIRALPRFDAGPGPDAEGVAYPPNLREFIRWGGGASKSTTIRCVSLPRRMPRGVRRGDAVGGLLKEPGRSLAGPARGPEEEPAPPAQPPPSAPILIAGNPIVSRTFASSGAAPRGLAIFAPAIFHLHRAPSPRPPWSVRGPSARAQLMSEYS